MAQAKHHLPEHDKESAGEEERSHVTSVVDWTGKGANKEEEKCLNGADP